MIKLKKETGVTLISLSVAVIILLIVTGVIIYNLKDNIKIEKLRNMQVDISNLNDKIEEFYEKNGKIPTKIKYENEKKISEIKETGVISDVADTGDFYIIDLEKIENLTLNYGEDYKKIPEITEELTEIQKNEINNLTDIYIINENSHNIFYVSGIVIDGQKFFTNYTSEDTDKVAVDLRYVDNIKIPENYSYIGKTANNEIKIKNNENNNEYTWKTTDKEIYDFSDIILDDGKKLEEKNSSILNDNGETIDKETFIENVNSYNGYYLYKTNTENKVIAISDIWTEYTKDEIIYKDKNENSVKIPKGFKICQTPKKNNVEDGLVIKDENNNSFIWIEVSKKVTEDAENEEKIEKSLQEYVGNYKKEEYEDQWYEGCGISTEKEYKEQKNKMLNSIKENGGFWLGQYEIGTQTQRKNSNDILTKAVCEKGAYPYNYITPKQAQTLANTFTVENYSCSLMYGIQWDLVCKFIEKYQKNLGTTENTIKNMINANSSDFANYKNTSFKLFSGKYSEDNGITWKQIDKKAYTKQEGKSVIATTGTSIRNKILNIYDIAGNVEEITLQKNINEDNFASRGGSYNSENVGISEVSINNESGYDLGFRITLY